MSLKYKSCPRCKKSWDIPYSKSKLPPGFEVGIVCECGVFYTRIAGGNDFIRSPYMQRRQYILWDIALRRCWYGSNTSISRGRPIVLPWLPFTTTKEQLKKWLVLA